MLAVMGALGSFQNLLIHALNHVSCSKSLHQYGPSAPWHFEAIWIAPQETWPVMLLTYNIYIYYILIYHVNVITCINRVYSWNTNTTRMHITWCVRPCLQKANVAIQVAWCLDLPGDMSRPISMGPRQMLKFWAIQGAYCLAIMDHLQVQTCIRKRTLICW